MNSWLKCSYVVYIRDVQLLSKKIKFDEGVCGLAGPSEFFYPKGRGS